MIKDILKGEVLVHAEYGRCVVHDFVRDRAGDLLIVYLDPQEDKTIMLQQGADGVFRKADKKDFLVREDDLTQLSKTWGK